MKASSSPDSDTEDVSIGRSETAMWMRIVSSWVCMLLYIWSLLAPVIMPDRCVPSVPARCVLFDMADLRRILRFSDI